MRPGTQISALNQPAWIHPRTLAARISHSRSKPLAALLRTPDSPADKSDSDLERVREIAHDLRNLLQAVQGFAWTATSRSTDETVREHLAKLQQATGDALTLIHRLTTPDAPGDAGVSCEVAPIVEDTVAIVRPRAGAGPDLVTELEAAGHARLSAGELRQLVLNLVLNATQAMADISGTIRVRATHEGGVVRLEVEDQGPGVPEALAERIFESGFTTRPDGTGLGLATVRQLVQRCGGSVELQRVEPHGARFVVLLPAAD